MRNRIFRNIELRDISIKIRYISNDFSNKNLYIYIKTDAIVYVLRYSLKRYDKSSDYHRSIRHNVIDRLNVRATFSLLLLLLLSSSRFGRSCFFFFPSNRCLNFFFPPLLFSLFPLFK